MTVTAICPAPGDAALMRVAERSGVEMYAPPGSLPRAGREYLAARRYLFEDVRGNPALYARHLRDVGALWKHRTRSTTC